MTAQPTEFPDVEDRVFAPEGTDRYSRYIYNFRDDNHAEQCVCGDSASWPEPRHNHKLTEADDLAGTFYRIRNEAP